jgi:extradiol dioxygenase family protein
VYALFGGKKGNKFVAYVGIADKLRQRISQHLIRRDSSITTMASIVTLNPDYITEIQWWTHDDFSERSTLEAAEMIAFELFNPVLRSRGKLTERAKLLLEDNAFQTSMRTLFSGEPTGSIEFLDFQDLVDKYQKLEDDIAQLTHRLTDIENRLKKKD